MGPPSSTERASFATTARLLSCLVTESLLHAIFVPLQWPGCVGIGIVLKKAPASTHSHIYKQEDVLAIVLLRHVPVLRTGPGRTYENNEMKSADYRSSDDDPRGKEIGLLDPLDMFPLVLVTSGDGDGESFENEDDLFSAIRRVFSSPYWSFPEQTIIKKLSDPLVLWDSFATSINLDPATRSDISDELVSSVRWQSYSYDHPPNPPMLLSPSIDWEQSIVEGHPTHPMHKTRQFLSPTATLAPGSYDLYSPRLRFVALPRGSLHVTGDFEALTRPILVAATRNAGKGLDIPQDHIIVPTHELQIPHILDKFKEATVYPEEFSVAALAQQSIRSVILPEILPMTHLKLGVGIKLTSAVRTISPASAYLGPRFSAQVVPALHFDPSLLTVARELASVSHVDPDSEIAKHCGAIVRECHENDSEARGERLVVCTSLVEYGHAGTDGVTPSVTRVFGLDTEDKRIKWLDDFVRVFFTAFLPPMLQDGVAFEAHPQNTVARFSLAPPHELRGFIIRDFGGLRVHPPTLLASTGVALDVVPGHSIVAETLDDVYTRMYHTVIHNHLQQLVRVLGLHYNGKGWEVIRARLHQAIPRGHALEKAWLGEEAKTIPGKCFMRMRMIGAYRHHLHGPFPNLLHYTGFDEESLVKLE